LVYYKHLAFIIYLCRFMPSNIRVRFAPSPTGGLHLGGMRTVLYNYLFAKKHGGQFILRIEDTDQTRFVAGAEQYIFDCLQWAGLEPDESTVHGGPYTPYRQSERKPQYAQYAQQLIQQGNAYYAFDTAAELETMRQQYKTETNPTPAYDKHTRMHMRNSLSLPTSQVVELLKNRTPYVVRFKMPENETVSFTDMVRGQVQFTTAQLDDKVLLKADGMPTYHLAVVVDDYLMKITHALRGEEWLPSAPLHVLLWKQLGWETAMPQWAHLPLILGPNGKLSKRDGAKYGFPVFAKNWMDKKNDEEGELVEGFAEKGFLPEAFINFLALLGWNDGTDKEIFTKAELVNAFDMQRVHSAGAKFDYEKAKWYNHEWIKKITGAELLPHVQPLLQAKSININAEKLIPLLELVKDRCHLLTDFEQQLGYFIQAPTAYAMDAVQPKWTSEKASFFTNYAAALENSETTTASIAENDFKEKAIAAGIKPGELQLPLRIMLVGDKYGVGVFNIIEQIQNAEAAKRIKLFLEKIL
jgi:glutamyl-tRNA synthetase